MNSLLVLENIYTIKKKKAEALSVTIKEAGLEKSAQKTVYIFMSHYRNVEQNHNIKTATKSPEM